MVDVRLARVDFVEAERVWVVPVIHKPSIGFVDTAEGFPVPMFHGSDYRGSESLASPP